MSEPQSFEPQKKEHDRLVSLISQARSGQTAAMEELLSIVRPRIRHVAQRRLDGKAYLNARFDASDVTQATLMDVVQDLGKFLGTTDTEFHAWLRVTIERNVIDEINKIIAAKRDVGRERSLDSARQDGAGLKEHIASSAQTPSQGLMRAEDRSRVEDALSDLPDELREVVRLKDIDGLSMSEIAARLGYNLRTAYRRYSQGIATLAELLSDNP